jgi:predicted 3-demethylubiquinone-9 3-methyltransferase (glyoxalase superfamily)
MKTIKQIIVPHLWYDIEAKEAAEFYASILPDSRVTNVSTLHDTPSGDCDVVSADMMRSGTKEQIARVTEAFLKMKKFDLRALQRAYDGK